MLRVVFIHLLLFLLPFIAYGFWLMVTRKAAGQEQWQDAPMLWLSIVGGAIVIVSLAVLATFDNAPSVGSYTPLEYRDGELVPGRIE